MINFSIFWKTITFQLDCVQDRYHLLFCSNIYLWPQTDVLNAPLRGVADQIIILVRMGSSVLK